MPAVMKEFQELVCTGIVARFAALRENYRKLSAAPASARDAMRLTDAAVVLQAPTGSGKTLLAIEVLSRVSATEGAPMIWLWFAPYSGLVDQASATFATQAPQLALLNLQSDRRVDALAAGGVFVTTWAALAARSAESRRARSNGDDGLSMDRLLVAARAGGMRIGCVVDEAHHGFAKANQAREFFTRVLKPDYALLMTATPRDTDLQDFSKLSGYRIGAEADWASIARADAVQAGLLKRGVRTVRFIAKEREGERLLDFEHLALRACTEQHRALRQRLTDLGIALQPLMLVQVPNGKEGIVEARQFLLEHLGFAENSVAVHTAEEPDAHLLALADDPQVEVLIFKKAVAMGFDAPRAFTLAALRGARDPLFGIQVIGRLMRVHRMLQQRRIDDPMLSHGYVFLANSESQEGLLTAGERINALRTQEPELGLQTVITVVGDSPVAQIARTGQNFELLVSQTDVRAVDERGVELPSTDLDLIQPAGNSDDWSNVVQPALALVGGGSGSVDGRNQTIDPKPVVQKLIQTLPLLVMHSSQMFRYERKAGTPDVVQGEHLPQATADVEARLVDHVDFSEQVLSTRLKKRVQVSRIERELFAGVRENTDEDEWTRIDPAVVADAAGQYRLRLEEMNQRELLDRLLQRLGKAIRNSGQDVPSEAELEDQLDLIIVRNPALLREAWKRARLADVVVAQIPLAAELQTDVRLQAAQRNIYGVYPPNLGANDEQELARKLDSNPKVRWWHRNISRTGLGLYSWDDGKGFYPDFIVSIEGRTTPHGIALLEMKGPQLWNEPIEALKATAKHREYGPVFFCGRARDTSEFKSLRFENGKLETDGVFDLERLRW